MQIFSQTKGTEYDSKIKEYELYLPEYFNKLAEAYRDYPEAEDNEEYKIYIHYNKWAIRKLEYSYVIGKMKKAMSAGAKILDAGCGVSSMPFLWSKLGGDVTAVDFDSTSINLMERFNQDNFFDVPQKISLETCDIMKLPFDNEVFDIVTTTSVLEHLPYPNYLQAISELYRVLKIGGTLICTCDISSREDSKRAAEGAFSINDIKDILKNFKGELVEEDIELDNLSLSEQEISKFWENHYFPGVGYEGNRGYVAVGFVIEKKSEQYKMNKLLPYEQAVAELKCYQARCDSHVVKLAEVAKYAHEKEEELFQSKKDLQQIEDESGERLKNIELLIAELREKEEMIQKQDDAIKDKEEMIQKQAGIIEEKEEMIQKQAGIIEEKEEMIQKQANVIEEKETMIQKQAGVIEEKEEMIQKQAGVIQENEK